MKIAVVLPSGPIRPGAEREAFEAGWRWLVGQGHELHLEAPHEPPPRMPWLAGTDRARAAALVAASRSGADRLWMGRGGYGAARTLVALEDTPVGECTLMGFSDGTALIARWTERGWPCWSAPPLVQLPRLDDPSLRRIALALGDSVPPFEDLETLVEGAAEGPLVGGNLAVLASLVGTPSMPRLAGGIAVIEDVGEPAYRVDRMLRQLLFAGALDGLRGLVCGDFTGIDPDEERAIFHAVSTLCAELAIPAAKGLPVGHDERNAPLPMGRPWMARLEARGERAVLAPQRGAS